MTESSYNCQHMTVNSSIQHELSLGVMCVCALFESSCQLLVNELSESVIARSTTGGCAITGVFFFNWKCAERMCFFSVLVIGMPAFVAVCSNEKERSSGY